MSLSGAREPVASAEKERRHYSADATLALGQALELALEQALEVALERHWVRLAHPSSPMRRGRSGCACFKFLKTEQEQPTTGALCARDPIKERSSRMAYMSTGEGGFFVSTGAPEEWSSGRAISAYGHCVKKTVGSASKVRTTELCSTAYFFTKNLPKV